MTVVNIAMCHAINHTIVVPILWLYTIRRIVYLSIYRPVN